MGAEAQGYNRTVVYVRRNHNELFRPADFDVCLMDYFGMREGNGRLDCTLENNIVYLQPPAERSPSSRRRRRTTESQKSERDCQSEDHEYSGYRFQHPSFCVARKITSADREALPPEIRERGVDVGVSALIESKDGSILMTRRALHMRTFPGVWVPPGGHCEEGETLVEVAARELNEETGLELETEEYRHFRILGLWESMYPPVRYRGPPMRHHLVVYLHGRMERTADALQSQLRLNYNEVNASVWLTAEMVEIVVKGSERKAEEIIPITTVDENGEHSEGLMNPKALRKKMPEPDKEVERITTGTRYALKLWLDDQE
ncbi:nucleoside diphosphate-linked moiety X motif 17-like [Macrobrachium rosenbergii]|uniref:nucleoside diphosphate-linked moiety X motif 17-like n=1 Tax=Macrobrachium rosenbergii TaxID=79674 RepID=UPI0034D5A0AE